MLPTHPALQTNAWSHSMVGGEATTRGNTKNRAACIAPSSPLSIWPWTLRSNPQTHSLTPHIFFPVQSPHGQSPGFGGPGNSRFSADCSLLLPVSRRYSSIPARTTSLSVARSALLLAKASRLHRQTPETICSAGPTTGWAASCRWDSGCRRGFLPENRLLQRESPVPATHGIPLRLQSMFSAAEDSSIRWPSTHPPEQARTQSGVRASEPWWPKGYSQSQLSTMCR